METAPLAIRAQIWREVLSGFAASWASRSNMFVEWSLESPTLVIRETSGFTLTLNTWEVTLTDGTTDVTITPNGDVAQSFTATVVEALDYLYHATRA